MKAVKSKRHRWLGLIFAGLSLALMAKSNPEAKNNAVQAPKESPIRVKTVAVEAKPWSLQWQGPAEIGAEQALTLKTEIAGRIRLLNLNEGKAVKSGQILVELDDSVLQAQLKQQELEQQLAAREYKRQQQLAAREATTQQSLDAAQGRWQQAEAAKTLLERQQQKSLIRAPFTGRLAFRQVSVGDYVSPGQALIDLVDTEHLWLEARLPQNWLKYLAPGLKIEFVSSALNAPIQTQIDRIAPAINPVDRSIRIRAKIDAKQPALKPGLFGEARILLEQQQVLVLPELALVTEPQGAVVFRVKGERVEKVSVQRGEARQGQIQILSGLSQDDRVVLAPPARLQSGMSIEEQP